MEPSNTELSQSPKSKSLSIGILMHMDIGNANAGWNEGVVTAIKKIERPDGYFHPYISGQALRRYIRDTMRDIIKEGNDNNRTPMIMSIEDKSVDKKSPVVTVGDPRKYIDDDIFGFMRAIKKEPSKNKKQVVTATADVTDETSNTLEATADVTDETSENNITEDELITKSIGSRKRTSPLRVSPAFGIFKLNSDRDLGTRSATEYMQSADAGGSIFETEITNNLFRTTILLELDRVGIWKGYETTNDKDKKGGALSDDERRERICMVLEAIKYLWGGGRQTRFLVDLSPQFIIYARMQRKIPIFLNCLDVDFIDGKYKIKTENITEAIKDYENDIDNLILGIRTGQFINNKADLGQIHSNIQILTIGEAIDKMIDDIKNAKF